MIREGQRREEEITKDREEEDRGEDRKGVEPPQKKEGKREE